MIDFLKQIIDFIELSNLISILLFFVSILIAFYFYFKSFYRIVYSTESISKTSINYIDWNNTEKIITTRLIFYNNGRKTITNDDIKTFNIKTNGKILNKYVLEGINHFDLEKSEKKLEVKINSLNTSKYFVLQITHTGELKINGKINETGPFLYNETITWKIINFIFVISFFINFGYLAFNYSESEIIYFKPMFWNLLLIILQIYTLRFVHSIFFIPDNTLNKFLSIDKRSNEFNNLYY